MKNLFAKIWMAAAFVIVVSCQKEQAVTHSNTAQSQIWKDLVAKNGAQTEAFTLEVGKASVIETQDKMTLSVPAHAFVFTDNSPVVGSVVLSVQEFNSISKLVLSDNQTVTTENQLLDSYGTFRISASQDGKPLKLRENMAISASKAFVAKGNLPKPQIQNWIAEPYAKGSIVWRLLEERRNSVSNRNEALEMQIIILNAVYNWDDVMIGTIVLTANADVEGTNGTELETGVFFVPNEGRSVVRFFPEGDQFVASAKIPPVNGVLLSFTVRDETLYLATETVKGELLANGQTKFDLKLSKVDENKFIEGLKILDERRR